ncbi:MAG: DUF2442 domain-containing protein [Burkholderiales bacterium]|nr:DUF2442 domain-containing protein [Burkholderiales bacterium]
MTWVTDAKHLGGYRLRVRFSDASEGEIDLADLILNDRRPIVAALRDPAAFAALRVDMDTVVWANGFDLAPEYLHARAKAATTA